jgi:hypothetical protein
MAGSFDTVAILLIYLVLSVLHDDLTQESQRLLSITALGTHAFNAPS